MKRKNKKYSPASIMFFIISKQLRGPPKPASASATIGAYQSRVAPDVFFSFF